MWAGEWPDDGIAHMTNEERDLITRFVERFDTAPKPGGFAGAAAPAAPPIDRDADALIGQLFTQYPEARYRLTQLAFVQEHALAEAQNQINQLQYQIQQMKQAAPQQGSPWGAAGQPVPQPSRGFFGGLFGGGQPPQPQYQPPQYAPPSPQYAPGYQPGMFQRQGSGFLGSALTTAAGVAGGMVAGNMLMNMFSGGGGHSSFASNETGGGGFGGFASAPDAGPWGAAPAAAPGYDPYDVGGQAKEPYQSPVSDPGGWQDAGTIDSGDTGGWSDAGGSDPDN